MKRFGASLVLGLVAAFASAADQYFAIYLNGGKVGYSVSRELKDGWSESETVFRSALMGQDLDMRIVSQTLADKDGQPKEIRTTSESGGRTQVVTAKFAAKEIKVVINNAGTITERTLAIPPGAKVVEDATSALILNGAGTTKSYKVHVLDVTTVTLIENEVTLDGPRKVEVFGKTYDATLVTVKDPRATSKIYYSAKGDVIKIEAALGMVMVPVTKEVALADITERTDLGESAAIRVSPEIVRPFDLISVKYRVSNADLSRCPSDAYQTIAKNGAEWIVSVHPIDRGRARDETITEAARYAQKWLKPSLHIPAGSPEFKRLSAGIVGGEKHVLAASERISRWIERTMTSNAGIGVLRDATEVLASKEGVCRDYAILGATLMRSAGIPTRVTSGLIYDNGQMYYHAWDEVWSGKEWITYDPTRANQPTNALRFKLAHGNVEDAFAFPVLQGCHFEIISTRYRS